MRITAKQWTKFEVIELISTKKSNKQEAKTFTFCGNRTSLEVTHKSTDTLDCRLNLVRSITALVDTVLELVAAQPTLIMSFWLPMSSTLEALSWTTAALSPAAPSQWWRPCWATIAWAVFHCGLPSSSSSDGVVTGAVSRTAGQHGQTILHDSSNKGAVIVV